MLRAVAAVVSGVLLAVDGGYVRRVPAKIWPCDSKLLCMSIDPFPKFFGGRPPLRACRAFDAHDVGRKPVAIATAEATAMVRPVGSRLEAACDRLAVVITERAGYAG